MRRHILFLALLLSMIALRGQDIHFSQFFNSPLTLNPAETGSFDGSFRATAIYRSQWASLNSPYKTFSSSYDHIFKWGLAPGDYTSGGMMMYSDKAGDANYTTTYVTLSGAYHKPVSDNQLLTFGLQFGYWQQKFESDKLYFADQFDGSSFTNKTTAENFQSQIQNKYDLNVGLRYAYTVNDDISLHAGAAVNHLTFIKNSFKGNQDERLALAYRGDIGMDYRLNEKMVLSPKIYFAQQSRAIELTLGSEASYLLETEKFTGTLYAGIFYRTRDAVYPYIAVKYNDMKIGLSYDATLSGLTAYNAARGGFEISFQYIGFIKPTPLTIVVPCIRI